MLTLNQIIQDCKILEIDFLPFHNKFSNCNKITKFQNIIEEFHILIKKQKRKLSKKYHPDLKTGNEEKMKQINETANKLLTLNIAPQNQIPITVKNIIINFSFFTDDITITNIW